MCVIASKRTQVDHDDGSWQVKCACRWVQHEYFHEGYHRFSKLNENRVLFYYFQSSDYLAPGTPQPLLLCRPTQLCHVLTLRTDSACHWCSHSGGLSWALNSPKLQFGSQDCTKQLLRPHLWQAKALRLRALASLRPNLKKTSSWNSTGYRKSNKVLLGRNS